MSTTHLFFRIVYNAIYVLLCLVTATLLLVVPGDIATQAIFLSHSWINVIILGIVIALALLIILFVYVTRLYITRMALAAIPRAWIPIEKGDVAKHVRELILQDLKRSAMIAWTARPKVTPLQDQNLAQNHIPESKADRRAESIVDEKYKLPGLRSFQALRAGKGKNSGEKQPPEIIIHQSTQPVWGHVEHDGWGSPNLADLPNVQYSTVLAELPNLIEAKAIAQAPPSIDETDGQPIIDPEAVEMLQLQQAMSMRTYLSHLTALGIVPESQISADFLDVYEKARFSTQPMSETTFRQLMHLFAELLRMMQPMDVSLMQSSSDIGDGDDEDEVLDSEDSEGGHIDDDAPQDTTPTTPAGSLTRSRSNMSYQSSQQSQTSSNRLMVNSYYSAVTSTRQAQHLQPPRHPQGQQQQQGFRTAPTTPRSRLGRVPSDRTGSTASQSGQSFAQTRRPYAMSSSGSSNASQRSGVSGGSQGSVIRLATADDEGDLPYVLTPVHSYTY